MKREVRRPLRGSQEGQALVLGLVLLMIALATVVVMYNNTQVTTEKVKVVNAADAAAYSGAVFVARNLNFMAYTNRAMIANHVAAGHYVSISSWVRYMNESMEDLEQVGDMVWWIPYVGPWIERITDIMAEVAEQIEEVVDLLGGDVLLPLVDGMGGVMSLAQSAAAVQSLGGVTVGGFSMPIGTLMREVAQTYDDRIRVNDSGDLGTTEAAIIAARIAMENGRIMNVVERTDAASDSGELEQMVDLSLGGSRAWIQGNRGWSLEPPVINLVWWLEKRGSTRHLRDGSKLDWDASDELVHHWFSFDPKDWGWHEDTWARGQTRASDLALGGRYDPIPSYYRTARSEGRGAQDTVLSITAYCVLPMDAARQKPLLGLDSGVDSITHAAVAEIHYQRPRAGFGGDMEEYANLYNPFWEARLASDLVSL